MTPAPWLVYGTIGVVGFVLTALLAAPGPYEVSMGPLLFDPFYVALSGFAFLVIVAIGDAVGLSVRDVVSRPRTKE